MKIRQILFSVMAMVAISCQQQTAFDPASVADAEGRVRHIEPLSWWVGMQTDLQLMLHGEAISTYDLRIEGEGKYIVYACNISTTLGKIN